MNFNSLCRTWPATPEAGTRFEFGRERVVKYNRRFAQVPLELPLVGLTLRPHTIYTGLHQLHHDQ